MKYLAIIPIALVFIACHEPVHTASLCKSLGYKGVVSEPYYDTVQYCSNGELVNGYFLTDEGAIAEVYSVKGTTYTREYIEFKGVKWKKL